MATAENDNGSEWGEKLHAHSVSERAAGMFMGNTDMHMFKMYGGQVYAVHAILGGATSSGWE